ncbi:hypothetical protein PG985_008745 [Apiospora marii]|uniref:uncharacterized protein n=1 Tax=Apiospora marii TaxID=335849 RepID=UPI00312E2D39
MSLRSQQHPEAFAQDLWEKLYAHCSAKKKIAQELGLRLAFATHVYTFVSVTNWLTKRSWRIKKPTGPPIFKTNMEKVIDLLWRVEPEIEKLKLETLREGQVRQLTQRYTRIGCDHSQCGDNQCCMWAVHFSKMLVMWYKETTLSRRVMGSPPLLLHEKARQVLIQNCVGVKTVGKHSVLDGGVDTNQRRQNSDGTSAMNKQSHQPRPRAGARNEEERTHRMYQDGDLIWLKEAYRGATKRHNTYNTEDSQVVTDPSTNSAL